MNINNNELVSGALYDKIYLHIFFCSKKNFSRILNDKFFELNEGNMFSTWKGKKIFHQENIYLVFFHFYGVKNLFS